ncbi:KH domain-containing protein HEN4-like isoform X1 [Amaranthus tricolor]|uniref:KH domain-containing protein HEN4-like isoform X1 n=1 Tax=Amaranthus tricolor TaxID=29722 RepID=UPI00258DCCC9|nr:KH domain-containing protein HEN4-like isoform X1 [Amaranthus tricolor]
MSDTSPLISPPPSSNGAKPQPPLQIPSGHAAIKILTHSPRIGAFIGKSGSSIKNLQHETGSRIRVENPLTQTDSDARIIVIVAPTSPFKKIQLRKKSSSEVEFEGVIEIEASAAEETAVRVFEKVLEVSGEGTSAATVCRVLVGDREAGKVIGKGGKTIEKLRRNNGAKIRVLSGDQLPSGVSSPDEVIEIEGEASSVKKALIGVCRHLVEGQQTENSSTKGSKHLESTSQPMVSGFHFEPPRSRTPLLEATTSSGPPTMGRSLLIEADKLPATNTKLQEVVFKILCSNARVGGVIGRGGSIVKALEEESGASINFGPSVANCDERLITISAKEDVNSRYSPAQRAVFLVFSRSVEAAIEKGLEGLNKGSLVSARLLVPSTQVGCLLGKGGVIISEMRKATGAGIHIRKGDQVPICATKDDEIVQISGQLVNTQDALYRVTSKLRDNIFTNKAMNNHGTGTGKFVLNTSLHGRARDGTPIGSHQFSKTSQFLDGNATSRHSFDPMLHPHAAHSPSTAVLNPRSFVTPVRAVASANGRVEHGRNHRPAAITNTTMDISIPESAVSSVYGENGRNLARIRQISGANVIVREAIPRTTVRTVVISGTPEQTQIAQSLLHAFTLTGSS